MISWLHINWERLFVPAGSLLEIVVRGSCMYLATFALLRMLRRQAGSLGTADLLVLLFIADAAQNGMAGEYKSITEGMVLISTIVLWEYAFDWLGFHWPWFQNLCERSELRLVKDGHIDREHLRSELITLDELKSHLRQKGVERVEQVRACYLEGDGHISVIIADGMSRPQPEEPQTQL